MEQWVPWEVWIFLAPFILCSINSDNTNIYIYGIQYIYIYIYLCTYTWPVFVFVGVIIHFVSIDALWTKLEPSNLMMVFSKITVSITSFLDVAEQSLEISWHFAGPQGWELNERVKKGKSGGFQPLIGNPYNGYINPYYWVDDHPLLYGNNGSLDPSTHVYRFHKKSSS